MPKKLFRLQPATRSPDRDVLPLLLADGRTIEVQRVRHPRARRMRLSVDERGARLTLPPRASLIAGERFVAEHREWLASQLQQYAEAEAPRLQPFHTDALPLRGEMLPLRWVPGRFAKVVRCDEVLQFAAPERASESSLRRVLGDFYEAQARADVGRWLPRYLAALPRVPRRLQFKRMSSQWGSLSPEATVALDLSLVLARPSAFEYVLVHELCHLIHPNHSRAFWKEVEARWPGWRDERDYFRVAGRRLKTTLRALLG